MTIKFIILKKNQNFNNYYGPIYFKICFLTLPTSKQAYSVEF